MRLNYIVCNLCHREMTDQENWIKFRMKKGWSSWYEAGWEGRTAHICPQCQAKLKIYCREHNWED